MNLFQNWPLSRLYIWRGLYESHLFGLGQTSRKQQKYDLDKELKCESIVTLKRGSHVPTTCQKKSSMRAVYLMCYRYPEQKPSHFEPSEKLSVAKIPFTKPSVTEPETEPTLAREKSSKMLSYAEFIKLLRSRIFLVRKPIGKAPPLYLESKLAQLLYELMALKEIYPKDWNEFLTFYQNHYPLLLSKAMDHETLKLQTLHSEMEINAVRLRNRCRDLNVRINKLDKLLDELEKETTEHFYTLLKTETFDPRRWPWNCNNYCMVELCSVDANI